MIEIQAVSHSCAEREILRNINLRLFEPRIGIIGSNGSGKSTFVRLLNGLLIPDRGDVWIDGLNTRQQTKAVRRKVGFVFQNPDHQIVLPIVEEDLAFGLKPLKLSKAETADRVDQILHHYHLEHLRHQPTYSLSGGEKQLLAIASVVITHPQYIIFDEPTTLLDLRNRNLIQRVLLGLTQTIIVVSHDLDLLNEFDRILVFEAGEIILDQPPAVALPYYVQLMS
jgi:biotin transport system ATP-binding protein